MWWIEASAGEGKDGVCPCCDHYLAAGESCSCGGYGDPEAASDHPAPGCMAEAARFIPLQDLPRYRLEGDE